MGVSFCKSSRESIESGYFDEAGSGARRFLTYFEYNYLGSYDSVSLTESEFDLKGEIKSLDELIQLKIC